MKIWHWPCWPAVRRARRPLAFSSRAPRCRSSSCSLWYSSWSSSSNSSKRHRLRRRLLRRLSRMRLQRLGMPNRWPNRRPTGDLGEQAQRTGSGPPPRPSRKRRLRRKATLAPWAEALTGQRPARPQLLALQMPLLLRWPPMGPQPRTLAQ